MAGQSPFHGALVVGTSRRVPLLVYPACPSRNLLRPPWNPAHRCRPSPPRPLRRKCAWPRTPGIRATRIGWSRSTPRTRAGATAWSFRWVGTEVHAFLVRKWAKELDYRLIKELWAVSEPSHRGALRLRMARRRGPVVPLARQRELAVQCRWATWSSAMPASTTGPSPRPSACFTGRWARARPTIPA